MLDFHGSFAEVLLGGLRRPEVPPGARRELVDALHDLHHRAGWPSLRTLAQHAGCSPTTVATTFSSPRLPTWGLLELIVEAMDGDVADFHRMWLAASEPTSARMPPLAGRKSELAAVRRHLAQGTGLLLVTGEAGIGKTRLVDTAVAASHVFVARGSGLPLSAQVPLLPVTDMLRSIYGVDQGQWLKEGLADCPGYVPTVLRRLLPDLGEVVDTPAMQDDDWWRQRLFTAVATTWKTLAAVRPLAVLVEDLHWVDSTTLDLLEHLLAVGPGLPVVGTWRQDDPTVPSAARDWLTRVRRLPSVGELALSPLTREATAEQMALLSGEPPLPSTVDRIYRRTAGQPLFTEQLLAQSSDDPALPDVLAELLDRRLEGLDGSAWRIARALGVADRPLAGVLLGEVTRLSLDELTAGLHGLADRRLLHSASSRVVELRHPLLAEAIRRRLVGPESVDEHRRIADALASASDAEPAEVAEHWRHADDPAEEIVWRIQAARAARQRFAATQESEEWLRVLELWPAGSGTSGTPPVTLARAYIATMDALKASLQFDRAADLSEEATSCLTEVSAADRAALLVRAADFRALRERPGLGLGLVAQALDLYATLEPSEEYVHALDAKHNQLMLLGRFDDAHQVAKTAVDAAEEIGSPHLHRQMLAMLAWHEAEAGDVAGGLRTAAKAQALLRPGADPRGDIRISVFHTDLLLRSGGSANAVEAAGAPGLAAAASAGIEDWQTNLVRSNVSEALTRAGFVDRAAALIDPVTEVPFDLDRWPLHLERAHLDTLRGLHDAARERLAPLREQHISILHQTGMLLDQIELVNYVAAIDLWGGFPEQALALLRRCLDEVIDAGLGSAVSATFVLAARAAADIREGEPRAGAADNGLRDLGRLRERAPQDLFTSTNRADHQALGASWRAECARLARQPSLQLWAAAAQEWDKLDRPPDAAYCRWRGAQVALATGQGTVALRMLRHASRQAREHVPLSLAITQTEAQGGLATRSG